MQEQSEKVAIETIGWVSSKIPSPKTMVACCKGSKAKPRPHTIHAYFATAAAAAMRTDFSTHHFFSFPGAMSPGTTEYPQDAAT
jgi:hypothetical protein